MQDPNELLVKLFSMSAIQNLLDQYSTVSDDIRLEKIENQVHFLIGILAKQMDDQELKMKFCELIFDYRTSLVLEILQIAHEKLRKNPSILKDFDGNSLATLQLIEQLDAILPKKYIMTNNKLANEMPKGSIDYGELVELKVNGKKDVFTQVTLNYDDNNIQIFEKDKRFTAYDRSVHNAICSLFEAGNTNFTPDQVYRCMNGLEDKQFVSPQAIGAITKSLDKSRRILVKIDYTDEARAYKKDTSQFIMEDYVLPAKKITVKAGGKEVSGYKIYGKPVLYEYAQVTKQVITIPSKLLNTKDVINTTPEVTVIREYLIRRIAVMKNDKRQSNKILLQKIYNEIGQTEPNKDKMKSVRNIVNKLLGKFQQEQYIKGYGFYKEGRAFKGIEIFH